MRSVMQRIRSVRRRSGARVAPVCAAVDLSGLSAGTYLMTVSVTDEATGLTVERAGPLSSPTDSCSSVERVTHRSAASEEVMGHRKIGRRGDLVLNRLLFVVIM